MEIILSFLTAFWLPVVLTTVVLFFASFLAWVVLPHHKPDVRRWPDEDRLLDFIRQSNAETGHYLFPLIADKDMNEDWAKERYARGPWGTMTLWPAQPRMGRNMALTVVYFFVVSTVIAFTGNLALPQDAPFLEVFQLVGLVALLAYTSGGVLREIWFTRPLRAKLMDFIDGVVFALITASLFAWLWG